MFWKDVSLGFECMFIVLKKKASCNESSLPVNAKHIQI